MGTIRIEEYSRAGTGANTEQPVQKLDTIRALTLDATTSTSAENITLHPNTKLVRVRGAEQHRVALGSDTTATLYASAYASEWLDVGVDGGEVLYYRLDA